MGGATEQKRRAFAGVPARRASARTGSGMVLEDAARGGSCLWTAWGSSHRAHLTEASARSTARAYFGRTKIGNICAHRGPKDGDNSKPGPTCAVPPIEPRAHMTEGAQRSAHRADRSNCAPAQVGHACGELPAVRLGPPDGSNHANGSHERTVSETLEKGLKKVGFKDRELASKYYHSTHVSVSPRITQVAVTQ